MFKVTTLAICFATLICSAQSPEGYWEGSFDVRGQDVQFSVTLKAGDPWTGEINIPIQGVNGLLLSDIAHKGNQVQFRMTEIPGDPTFKGEMSADGSSIAGNLEQSGQAFSFSLAKKDKPSDVFARAKNFKIDPIAGEGPGGIWRAILKVGPSKLHLELTVTKNDSGEFEGKLNSVDQNMVIAVDTISLTDGNLKFSINRLMANFSGTTNKNQSAAEGKWRQAGQEMDLTFFRIKN